MYVQNCLKVLFIENLFLLEKKIITLITTKTEYLYNARVDQLNICSLHVPSNGFSKESQV